MAEGPRPQPRRRNLLRHPRKTQILSIFSDQFLVRAWLWRTMRRDARHPLARQLRRQLKQGRRLPILPFSLACALPLAVFAVYTFNVVDEAIGWALPPLLMLYSAVYCVFWIARIVALFSRQARQGAMDEVSVIPPGRLFIYLTICKVVLNEDDALYWLGLLRRVLAAGVFMMLIMSLFVAATQLDQLSPWEMATVFIELGLVAVVIPMEHNQSVLSACLLAVLGSTRLSSAFDRASATIAGFLLLQILSYALSVGAVVALGRLSLSLALALFLLARELLILLLWRAILLAANEDNAPARSLLWQGALRRRV